MSRARRKGQIFPFVSKYNVTDVKYGHGKERAKRDVIQSCAFPKGNMEDINTYLDAIWARPSNLLSLHKHRFPHIIPRRCVDYVYSSKSIGNNLGYVIREHSYLGCHVNTPCKKNLPRTVDKAQYLHERKPRITCRET